MSKDAYWFSHDANARNDEKILALRAEFGSRGYGLFWMIIEIMREQTNYKLKDDDKLISKLCVSLNEDKKTIESLMRFGLEIDLFRRKNGFIYSQSLLNRLGKYDKRREAATKAAKKRWEGKAKEKRTQCERNANAMRTHNERNARRVQESTGDKSTEESPGTARTRETELNKKETFNIFRKLYESYPGEKRTLQTEFENYSELPHNDQPIREISFIIDAFQEQYRIDPARKWWSLHNYLNNRYYETELSNNNGNTTPDNVEPEVNPYNKIGKDIIKMKVGTVFRDDKETEWTREEGGMLSSEGGFLHAKDLQKQTKFVKLA